MVVMVVVVLVAAVRRLRPLLYFVVNYNIKTKRKKHLLYSTLTTQQFCSHAVWLLL
jgi:hypothetical protein